MVFRDTINTYYVLYRVYVFDRQQHEYPNITILQNQKRDKEIRIVNCFTFTYLAITILWAVLKKCTYKLRRMGRTKVIHIVINVYIYIHIYI